MAKRKSIIRLAGSKADARHMAFTLRHRERSAQYYKTKRGWVVRTVTKKAKRLKGLKI